MNESKQPIIGDPGANGIFKVVNELHRMNRRRNPQIVKNAAQLAKDLSNQPTKPTLTPITKPSTIHNLNKRLKQSLSK